MFAPLLLPVAPPIADRDPRFLRATVDGEPVRAFFDTGAWSTMAKSRYRGRTLRVLGRTFSLKQAGKIPRSNPQTADVYLGLDFARTGPISFDPATGFSSSAPATARAWTAMRRKIDEHLHVFTRFDDITLDALMDTGADASVVNTDLDEPLPRRWFRSGTTTQVETFYGDVAARVMRIGRVSVGDAELGRDVRVFGLSFAFLQPDGRDVKIGRDVPPAILGWDVLGQNRWTLDASGARVAFESTEN